MPLFGLIMVNEAGLYNGNNHFCHISLTLTIYLFKISSEEKWIKSGVDKIEGRLYYRQTDISSLSDSDSCLCIHYLDLGLLFSGCRINSGNTGLLERNQIKMFVLRKKDF